VDNIVITDGAQCMDSHSLIDSWGEGSVIGDTFFRYCDCVPDWMGEGVYFEPVATLYLAIFVVVIYLVYNRLRPVVLLASNSWYKANNKHMLKAVKFALDKYHELPETAKKLISNELKGTFPTMPNIGCRIINKEKVNVNVGVETFTNTQRFMEWKSSTLAMIPELLQCCNKSKKDMEVWEHVENHSECRIRRQKTCRRNEACRR
jgi:hypothetical protein